MPAQTTDKLDLYKRHKDEYATPKQPRIIEIGPAQYLAVEGAGAPGSALFEARIGALYGMAYTLKFMSKFAGRDYVVCKLEGLYWTKGGTSKSPAECAKDDLTWKLLIRVPDFIKEKDLAAARAQLREKGKEGDFDEVTLETLTEGRCVQMLHVGPYDDEQRTIDLMLEHAAAEGCRPHGRHHEIYLSDPRRVPPEKLRTILRQPVK